MDSSTMHSHQVSDHAPALTTTPLDHSDERGPPSATAPAPLPPSASGPAQPDAAAAAAPADAPPAPSESASHTTAAVSQPDHHVRSIRATDATATAPESASAAAASFSPLATADDIRIGSILVDSDDRLCEVVRIQLGRLQIRRLSLDSSSPHSPIQSGSVRIIEALIPNVLHTTREPIYGLWRPETTDSWTGSYYLVKRLIGKHSYGGVQQVEYFGNKSGSIPLQWQTLRVSGQAQGVRLPPFCHLRNIEAAHIAAAYRSRPQLHHASASAAPQGANALLTTSASMSSTPTDVANQQPATASASSRGGAAADHSVTLARAGEGQTETSAAGSSGLAGTDAEPGERVGTSAPAVAGAATGAAGVEGSPTLLSVDARAPEVHHEDARARVAELAAPVLPAGTRQTGGATSAAVNLSANAVDLGVGSTILRRNAHGEFEIHTIGGRTKRGEKVRLDCSRSRRGRLVVAFDDLFIPSAADLLPDGKPAWALFDRNIERPHIDPAAVGHPDWTTVYYFAQMSSDQEGVADGARIIYRDAHDDGLEVVVPAVVDIHGQRMPAVVQPRPLTQAEIASLKAMPTVSTSARRRTDGRSDNQSAIDERERQQIDDASAAEAYASTGTPDDASTAAATAEGSNSSRQSGADRHKEPITAATAMHSGFAHPAASAPSTVTVVEGGRRETRPAADSPSARTQSSPSARSAPPSAAAESVPAAVTTGERRSIKTLVAKVLAIESEPGAATAAQPAASAAAVSIRSDSHTATAPAPPEFDADDEPTRACVSAAEAAASAVASAAALAAASLTAVKQLPELRQLLDERRQLAELELRHQSFKRKADADLQAAHAKFQRARDECRVAKRESVTLKEQLEQRAATCAKLEESLQQEMELRQKVEAELQSHKRKAVEDLTAIQRERDEAVQRAAAATAKTNSLLQQMRAVVNSLPPSFTSPSSSDATAATRVTDSAGKV